MAKLDLLTPKGFQAAGVACGVKTQADVRDLGLLVADEPAEAAAVFTTNKVVAAPVVLGRDTIKSGRLRVVVVNSGNANACTGEQGMADARTMARIAAEAVGAAPDEVLVSSTGIIGHPLPMDRITAGIRDAAGRLDRSSEASEAFARAIMTTDTAMKTSAAQADIGSAHVTVAGVCKGAGMISPNMATMLAYLTTDARIIPAALRSALRAAVDVSFNTVTVDGHTSTNDTVAILASGTADSHEIAEGTAAFERFASLLKDTCIALALQIVADGEGATRVVEVRVEGARTKADAALAARAVANSPLVKCAVHGGDPNWGRVVSAVGYSGAGFDAARLRHWIGDELVFADGMPTQCNLPRCQEHMAGNRVLLRVDLGAGNAAYTCTTCDLSRDYVAINADYHT